MSPEQFGGPADPSAPPPPPAPPLFQPTHVVPGGGLSAWSTPDPSAAPLASLRAGTELRVEEERGAWARVTAWDDWSGWVDGRRLVARVIMERPPLEVLGSEARDKAIKDARRGGTILIVLGVLAVFVGMLLLGNARTLEDALDGELTVSPQVLAAVNFAFGAAAVASGAGVKRLSRGWRTTGIVVAIAAIVNQLVTLATLGNSFSVVGIVLWVWVIALLGRSGAAFAPVASMGDFVPRPGAEPATGAVLQAVAGSPPPPAPATPPQAGPPWLAGEARSVSATSVPSHATPGLGSAPEVSAPPAVEACPRCGVARRVGARFCGACGASFSPAVSPAGEGGQPPPPPPPVPALRAPAPPEVASQTAATVSPSEAPAAGWRRWPVVVGLATLTAVTGAAGVLVLASGGHGKQSAERAATRNEETDDAEAGLAAGDEQTDEQLEVGDELNTVGGPLVVTTFETHEGCVPEIGDVCADYPAGSNLVIVTMGRADGEAIEGSRDELFDSVGASTLSATGTEPVSPDGFETQESAEGDVGEREIFEISVTYLWPTALPSTFEFHWPGNPPMVLGG